MKDTPTTKPIDDFMAKKVLDRLGRVSGDVTVNEEEWDLGMCDTCSSPEDGFAVYVDGKLVWPNDEVLSAQGGYIYADDSGYIKDGQLSTYGYFFDWLDGKSLEDEDEEDYEDEDEDE